MGLPGEQAEGVPPRPRPRRTLAEALERRRRVALAGHHGDADLARRHLDDDDPTVRATALRALLRASDLRGSEIRTAVADADPGVRRAAAEALAVWRPGRHGPDDAEVGLRSLLDDADPSVVEVAAWAAGEIEPAGEGVVARLVELTTGHDDALVREAAVAALGALGDPAGLPAILAATGDRATVRRRAVLALAPFDSPEVTAALERARTDRDWQVRQAAEDLLDPETGA